MEYRIAYIAFCIENNLLGRELLESLKEITVIDPENIQFILKRYEISILFGYMNCLKILHEGVILIPLIKAYKELHGHFPETVYVDPIFRNR